MIPVQGFTNRRVYTAQIGQLTVSAWQHGRGVPGQSPTQDLASLGHGRGSAGRTLPVLLAGAHGMGAELRISSFLITEFGFEHKTENHD